MYWLATIVGFCVGATVVRVATSHQRARDPGSSDQTVLFRTDAIDLIPLPLLIVDSKGYVLRCNSEIFSLLGYEKEQLTGKGLQILFSQHQWKIAEQKLLAGSKEPMIYTVRKRDGKQFPARIIASQFESEAGAVKLFCLLDQTDLKQFKTQKKHHEAQYQKLVEESDAVVHQISHDLKSPFRQIAQYSQMLSRELGKREITEQEKRYLDTVVSLAKKGTDLINYILKINRLGREGLSFARFDLNVLFEEVISSLQTEFPNHTLSCQIDPNLPVVTADKLLVEDLVSNLASNCFKYSQDRNVKIEVGLAASGVPFQDPDIIWSSLAQPEEQVFYIRDEGIGIGEENFREVFHVFRRLHAKESFEGGHGVGLTIVRKIIHLHGGKIWLQSEEGLGTTFYFTLGFHHLSDSGQAQKRLELAQGGV